VGECHWQRLAGTDGWQTGAFSVSFKYIRAVFHYVPGALSVGCLDSPGVFYSQNSTV